VVDWISIILESSRGQSGNSGDSDARITATDDWGETGGPETNTVMPTATPDDLTPL
jgi:hypothetical protein